MLISTVRAWLPVALFGSGPELNPSTDSRRSFRERPRSRERGGAEILRRHLVGVQDEARAGFDDEEKTPRAVEEQTMLDLEIHEVALGATTLGVDPNVDEEAARLARLRGEDRGQFSRGRLVGVLHSDGDGATGVALGGGFAEEAGDDGLVAHGEHAMQGAEDPIPEARRSEEPGKRRVPAEHGAACVYAEQPVGPVRMQLRANPIRKGDLVDPDAGLGAHVWGSRVALGDRCQRPGRKECARVGEPFASRSGRSAILRRRSMRAPAAVPVALRLLGFSLAFSAGPAAAQEDGLALMQAVDKAGRSDGEQTSVRMELSLGSGRKETRTFRMWLSSPDGKPLRSLIRFESPANIAGTALLSVRRPDGGQDNHLYVPALQQVRRIAAADRRESFVQSDFTIEDLTVGIDPKSRVYTILGPADCGERSCVQVEDKPRDEAAGKASGYGRVLLYVDSERHVVHRVDFYDKAGTLLKVLKAEGLVEVSGKWRFTVARLANVQTGSSTVMTVLDRKLGAVDEGLFSPSTLATW
jgi:hypothetical protein